MSDNNAEKQQLKRSLENKVTQLNDYITRLNNEKAELNHKKQRLVKARDTVAEKKGDFRKLQRNDDTNINSKYSWKGSTYDEFTSYGSQLTYSDTCYESSVDTVHDELNIEINNIEKQIAQRTGLISSCVAEINGLWVRIGNIFN